MPRLTNLSVANLKPATTRREVPDPGQRGLYVIVRPTGRKTFAVRYRLMRTGWHKVTICWH
jgi:hypothetical protein